jgi:hypothetical protein
VSESANEVNAMSALLRLAVDVSSRLTTSQQPERFGDAQALTSASMKPVEINKYRMCFFQEFTAVQLNYGFSTKAAL